MQTPDTILITGGCGFIGSHFVRRALAMGYRIINVDKLTYAGHLENVSDCQSHPQYVFYQSDICDFDAIGKILRKEQPQVVVNMAAETHVDRSIDSGAAFVQTNVMGTFQLLQASLRYYQSLSGQQKQDFRFLHLSTDEVFGAVPPRGDKFCETTPYNPSSPYSASKAGSDLMAQAFHKTYGLPTIIVNCVNNYGTHQFPEKLIPLMILNALNQQPLPVYGDGQQIRDWIFVEDTVEVLFQLITKGVIGASYCVSGEDEWANIDLIHKICDLLDRKKPLANASYQSLITYVKDRPGHDRRYALNASKLRKTINWKPNYSIDQGLSITIDWYIHQAETLNQLFDRHRLGVL